MINIHNSITAFVILLLLGTLTLFYYADSIPRSSVVLEGLLIVCSIFAVPAHIMNVVNEYS